MPAKNNPLTKNSSSSRNSIQSGSNDEENSSLKIVIAKNTQNNPNDSPDWIIKTGKRLNSPGISPASKGINTKQNKFTYTTPNRYEALNISDNETEINIEKEGENENMQTENTILPPISSTNIYHLTSQLSKFLQPNKNLNRRRRIPMQNHNQKSQINTKIFSILSSSNQITKRQFCGILHLPSEGREIISSSFKKPSPHNAY